MFERYTEKARRSIFFARYEASQFGSKTIAPEHLLLGILREDKTVSGRFFHLASQVNVDLIRREIEGRTVLREKIPQSAELVLAPAAKKVLLFAHEESERLQSKYLGTEHLLLGILREERSTAAEILMERGLHLHGIREEIIRQNGIEKPSKQNIPHLAEFCRDLTEAAQQDRLDPLIGRENELERTIQILCRRTKNNPLLIGEPGVGKTALVEGLAQRIASGDVPNFLEHKRLLALDLSLVVAGTKYRGQFEERMKGILRELKENPYHIIFIDEIHTLVGAGSAEGTLDAANILKPALSRGEIQCIGATTTNEFRRIEKDKALERRFQTVRIAPPSEEDTLLILEGLREKYESFHQVHYTPEAIEAAVFQTNRYITERAFPDKAIDVLDEAGARVKLRTRRPDDYAEIAWSKTVKDWRKNSPLAQTEEASFTFNLNDLDDSLQTLEVRREDVEEVIARWTGIPLTKLKETEAKKLLRLETELHNRVISQDKAISALSRAIRRSRAGLKSAQRPVGSFLFLGATGVGKTEVARSLAEFLFGSEKALIRFDMSEFMERHSVAKLIGSPPGYVGHEDGGQLTEKMRRRPYSVVLFDEIEKAHPDLFNILLQVFDDGILTDSRGNQIDCKNAIFIMTSNIGARQIQKRGTLGFQLNADQSREKLEENVMSAVKRTFAPEFINRLDEIVIFEELTDEDLHKIVNLQIDKLNETLFDRELRIRLTPESVSWLVEKTCQDRSYGARPLRRAIQRYVEDKLSDALIGGELEDVEEIEVFVSGEELDFRPTKKKEYINDLLLLS